MGKEDQGWYSRAGKVMAKVRGTGPGEQSSLAWEQHESGSIISVHKY